MNLRGWVEPCVLSPRGHPTNHHWGRTPEGRDVILDRVKPGDATHYIVVACPVDGLGERLEATVWADVVPA